MTNNYKGSLTKFVRKATTFIKLIELYYFPSLLSTSSLEICLVQKNQS